MATETKEKPLSAEDIARIVEQALDKREGRARQKRREGLEVEDADLAKMELQAEMIGNAVEAALDRRAKRAEAEANAKAEEEAKKKPKGFWE